jgi:hypothetical protein
VIDGATIPLSEATRAQKAHARAARTAINRQRANAITALTRSALQAQRSFESSLMAYIELLNFELTTTGYTPKSSSLARHLRDFAALLLHTTERDLLNAAIESDFDSESNGEFGADVDTVGRAAALLGEAGTDAGRSGSDSGDEEVRQIFDGLGPGVDFDANAWGDGPTSSQPLSPTSSADSDDGSEQFGPAHHGLSLLLLEAADEVEATLVTAPDWTGGTHTAAASRAVSRPSSRPASRPGSPPGVPPSAGSTITRGDTLGGESLATGRTLSVMHGNIRAVVAQVSASQLTRSLRVGQLTDRFRRSVELLFMSLLLTTGIAVLFFVMTLWSVNAADDSFRLEHYAYRRDRAILRIFLLGHSIDLTSLSSVPLDRSGQSLYPLTGCDSNFGCYWQPDAQAMLELMDYEVQQARVNHAAFVAGVLGTDSSLASATEPQLIDAPADGLYGGVSRGDGYAIDSNVVRVFSNRCDPSAVPSPAMVELYPRFTKLVSGTPSLTSVEDIVNEFFMNVAFLSESVDQFPSAVTPFPSRAITEIPLGLTAGVSFPLDVSDPRGCAVARSDFFMSADTFSFFEATTQITLQYAEQDLSLLISLSDTLAAEFGVVFVCILCSLPFSLVPLWGAVSRQTSAILAGLAAPIPILAEAEAVTREQLAIVSAARKNKPGQMQSQPREGHGQLGSSASLSFPPMHKTPSSFSWDHSAPATGGASALPESKCGPEAAARSPRATTPLSGSPVGSLSHTALFAHNHPNSSVAVKLIASSSSASGLAAPPTAALSGSGPLSFAEPEPTTSLAMEASGPPLAELSGICSESQQGSLTACLLEPLGAASPSPPAAPAPAAGMAAQLSRRAPILGRSTATIISASTLVKPLAASNSLVGPVPPTARSVAASEAGFSRSRRHGAACAANSDGNLPAIFRLRLHLEVSWQVISLAVFAMCMLFVFLQVLSARLGQVTSSVSFSQVSSVLLQNARRVPALALQFLYADVIASPTAVARLQSDISGCAVRLEESWDALLAFDDVQDSPAALTLIASSLSPTYIPATHPFYASCSAGLTPAVSRLAQIAVDISQLDFSDPTTFDDLFYTLGELFTVSDVFEAAFTDLFVSSCATLLGDVDILRILASALLFAVVAWVVLFLVVFARSFVSVSHSSDLVAALIKTVSSDEKINLGNDLYL